MDQRLIFAAMMLFIVPFTAALGKNLFLPYVRVKFRRDKDLEAGMR